MNPSFTYAYTLLGHEYVLTEELDRAMSCFRQAVRTDSRHYNAWLVYVSVIYFFQVVHCFFLWAVVCERIVLTSEIGPV